MQLRRGAPKPTHAVLVTEAVGVPEVGTSDGQWNRALQPSRLSGPGVVNALEPHTTTGIDRSLSRGHVSSGSAAKERTRCVTWHPHHLISETPTSASSSSGVDGTERSAPLPHAAVRFGTGSSAYDRTHCKKAKFQEPGKALG